MDYRPWYTTEVLLKNKKFYNKSFKIGKLLLYLHNYSTSSKYYINSIITLLSRLMLNVIYN